MPFLPLPPRTVGALGRKRFVGEFHTRGGHTALCCRLISSFYIKPQLWLETISLQIIVLYRLSTSNHNSIISLVLMRLLSYIVFLHQTTTRGQLGDDRENCLISSFYIKPQPCLSRPSALPIVLYRLSTSNHNWGWFLGRLLFIVLYRLSTSNHNPSNSSAIAQLIVLYRLSTSNHNQIKLYSHSADIVLYRLSTSNHNPQLSVSSGLKLSYIVFLHQTTTGYTYTTLSKGLSYIVFLHQTTTS